MQNINRCQSAGEAFGDVRIADAIAMAAESPPLRDEDGAIIGADFSDAPADVFEEPTSAVDLDDDYAEADDVEYAAFVRGDHDQYTALRAAQHRRRRVRDALSTLFGRDLGGAEITITITL